MNLTSRLTRPSSLFLLAIGFLLSSPALAQIHDLPSSFRGDSDFSEPGLAALPQSMLKGLAELQAYRRLAPLDVSVDVDDPTLAPCSTAIIVADPADLTSALNSEASNLLGLEHAVGDFTPTQSTTLTIPKRVAESNIKASLRGRASRQMLSVR